MGRPPKLTPEVQGEIVNAIVAGATYKAAAEYAGVGYSTFAAWMVRRGKQYREFQEAVTRANARARVNLLARIQQSAKDGDWRAAAWILERRFSDEYGAAVRVDFKKMTDDELRDYIASEYARLGGGAPGGEPAAALPGATGE